MVFKNVTLTLLINIIVFAATIVFLTLTIQSEKWFYVSIIFGLLIIAEVYNLILFYNSVNRKVAYFFEAVKNDDSSLVFPETITSKSIVRLHKSMNNINKLISDIKISNQSNEKFLIELINHSSTGLMSVDNSGYIGHINNSAKTLLGINDTANFNTLKQQNPVIFKILNSIAPFERRSVKLLFNSEVKHLVIQKSTLKFKDEEYDIFSLDDIKKEIDENELDSYQKLIRVMTHEIMNSIAPITSLSNTISRYFYSKQQPKKPDEITQKNITNTIDGLSIIEEQGEALIHFVDNYRKLTKLPEPNYKNIVVKDWLNSFVMLYKTEMESRDIIFRVAFDNNISNFISDDKLLNQVIINVIKNAIHAVQNSTNKEIALILELSETGKRVIKISDTGCGIESTLIDKIFIPFFTTKTDGDGIGLSLSRQIIKRLGGTFAVKSELGKGTQVIISL